MSLPSFYFSAFFSKKTSERSTLPSTCYTVHLQWLVTQGSTSYVHCQQHEHLIFMGTGRAIKARQQIVLRDQLCSSESSFTWEPGCFDVPLPTARHRNTAIRLIRQKYSTLIYTMKAALQTVWKHILIKTAWKCLILIWKGKKCRKNPKDLTCNVWYPKHSLARLLLETQWLTNDHNCLKLTVLVIYFLLFINFCFWN